MLPDFPDLKRRLLTITRIAFHHKVRENGLIGAIKQMPYFEGNRFETHDVDGDGQPDLSFIRIVVHPELGRLLQEKGPEWEADPAFQKRRDEIIARKRIEWSDRESNRKLVD